MGLGKTGANSLVERRVLGEPFCRPGRAPEGDNLLRQSIHAMLPWTSALAPPRPGCNLAPRHRPNATAAAIERHEVPTDAADPTPKSTLQPVVDPPPINWLNALWLALAILAMIAVIAWGNLWALNFLHVASGLLWTGIDLFMGFVIGPILRQAPFEARRAVLLRLTPRTMFILPGLAIVTGTTGWYLARDMGYLAMDWPEYGWVLAALIIAAILTVQGIGLSTADPNPHLS